MNKIRTILAFPFALISYVLMIPTLLMSKLACVIRGKDWPLMHSNEEEEEK